MEVDDVQFSLVEKGPNCSIIGKNSKIIRSFFSVDALCCIGEAELIRRILVSMEGVDNNIALSVVDVVVTTSRLIKIIFIHH